MHRLIEWNAPAALIDALLKQGYPVDIHDKKHANVLELCLEGSNRIESRLDSLKVLLAAGADPNGICSNGYTLLHYAVDLNRVEETKILLDAGADPTRLDIFGAESESAIDLATRLGNEAAEYVLGFRKQRE